MPIIAELLTFVHALPDTDLAETQEWLDSLSAVVGAQGQGRARFLMSKLLDESKMLARVISARRARRIATLFGVK